MNNPIPGINGSFGQCGYCGETFLKELLLSKRVKTAIVGGVDLAFHKKDCWNKFDALIKDGRLEFSAWRDFPEKSPIRAELIRLEQEATQSVIDIPSPNES